jgi:diaminopimelate decarboxylase
VTAFAYQHSILTADDVPLADVARALGTPTYVYSASVVRERFAAFDRAFRGHPHAVHVALKANSSLAIVRLLVECGASVDANSIGEIEVARRAGASPSHIVFTGVGKTRDELAHAIALGLHAINVESAGELARVAEIAGDLGARARVAIRVNPDIDARTHPHIATGLRRSKFGVPVDQVADLCRRFRSTPGLAIVGLHVHIGSQIVDLAPLRQVAGTMVDLERTLRAEGLALEYLDLGGGLGIGYDGARAPGFDEYAAALLDVVRPAGLPLVLEPGRALLAPAGVLLTRIVDVKTQADGRTVVVLDAAMTDLLRPALYGAYHAIDPVILDADRPETVADVVGPVCESSDSFGLDRSLPEPREGGLLAIRDVGAYGAVMASNYNRRPIAAEVLVDGGAWRVVRRRQTVAEMLTWER